MDCPKIERLKEDVINRIAAGEIIQRPANALKELIENSLDAKSTNIQITVKDVGLKSLQIQDNGTGIRKEDFQIVCERFTTSKLREFEDLQTVSTYGFRGEALASISHIAHLSITSKTINDICAYQASFVDGKLQGNPKPVAGNQGTIITVEDLFYNMNVRRKALRSPAEEYQKISDVVSKYAVHNFRVGFALKKSGGNNDIKTPPNSTVQDNIKIIYGNSIARELINFSLENKELGFKTEGYMTNVNFSTKKFQFLLFINHRLVDCQSLKKSIDHVYSTYLPKNSHPFVYLTLEIDPLNVDVNVHPTKHEVHFLNEEEIVESITQAMEVKLLGSNNSRAFFTHSKLPKTLDLEQPNKFKEDSSANKSMVAPQHLVRTDAKEQKLDKLFEDIRRKEEKKVQQNESITEEEFQKFHQEFLDGVDELEEEIQQKKQLGNLNNLESHTEDKLDKVVVMPAIQESPKVQKTNSFPIISKLERKETKLTSILNARKMIESNCHTGLRETFANHVFVGPVSLDYSLIQHSTKLYLCQTPIILSELFYQFVIYNFQNFDVYRFTNKLPIVQLARMGLNLPEIGWTEEDGDKDELSKRVVDILKEKSEMLSEYFSFEIDNDGNLCGLPILLKNYFPNKKGLVSLVIRLASEVDWENEENCFETFSRELAKFYSNIPEDSDKNWRWLTEHLLYPAIKNYFIPPKSFMENCSILEVANLPKLYKVFERC